MTCDVTRLVAAFKELSHNQKTNTTTFKSPSPPPPGQFRTPWDQRYTVLELPYLGRSLSLQVVLPSERKTPLSSLEAQLSARQLASWDAGLRRTKMDVLLPR